MTRWKYINGYGKDYKIYSDGTIVSCSRKMWNGKIYWTSKERKLKIHDSKVGYYMVALSKDKNSKLLYLHRLLGQHFISNPENKPQINHKDGDKKNFDLSNLEWVTNAENSQHAVATGLSKWTGCKGEKNGSCKISEEMVREIRKLKKKETLEKTGSKYGISVSQIWAIQNYKSWKHI